ncbi:MAG: hypothetical protein ACKO37_05570 [Vampirovibrionales bacterium]
MCHHIPSVWSNPTPTKVQKPTSQQALQWRRTTTSSSKSSTLKAPAKKSVTSSKVKVPTIPKKVVPVASITQTIPKFVSYAMPTPTMDFIRTIPISPSFTETRFLPSGMLTLPQAQVLLMNDTTSHALHMEVIRLATHQLSASDQQKLMYTLYQRYQKDTTNPRWFFDYGWAQLALQRNKTGLFFLRKANDKLAQQDTMLAYAMAQVEADLVAEGNPPEEPTVRKTDVMFKLKDAIALQMEHPKQGFWPTYVRLLERLSPFAAYDSFVSRDYSLQLFPKVAVKQDYSIPSPKPVTTSVSTSNATASKTGVPLPHAQGVNSTSGSISIACGVSPTAVQQVSSSTFLNGEWVKVSSQNTPPYRLFIYQASETATKRYHALVVNEKNQAILALQHLSSYRLQEDPNGDGIPELVVRQYQDNRFDPVMVYSLQPETGCYTRNTDMTRIFQ